MSNRGSSDDEPEEMATRRSRSSRAGERKRAMAAEKGGSEPAEEGEREERRIPATPDGLERPKKKRKMVEVVSDEEVKSGLDVGDSEEDFGGDSLSKSALKNLRRRERKRARERELALSDGQKGILKTPQNGSTNTPAKRVTFKLDEPISRTETDSGSSDEETTGDDIDVLGSNSDSDEDFDPHFDLGPEEGDESDSDGYIGEAILLSWQGFMYYVSLFCTQMKMMQGRRKRERRRRGKRRRRLWTLRMGWERKARTNNHHALTVINKVFVVL